VSLRLRGSESRHPFQPPPSPRCCREVYELPSEGTSDASHQIASVSSDRCAQQHGLGEKIQRPRGLPAGSNPGAPFGWWEVVLLRKMTVSQMSSRTPPRALSKGNHRQLRRHPGRRLRRSAGDRPCVSARPHDRNPRIGRLRMSEPRFRSI
jgi:hypothetical protein